MKKLLSLTLYYMGHFISVLIRCGFLSFLYPVYKKLMLWSCDLDIDGKVWKNINSEKEHKHYYGD